MNLILPNIKEVEEDPKKVELENLIVGYINRIIKFDIELCRTKENFFIDVYNNITKNLLSGSFDYRIKIFNIENKK